MKLNAQIAVGVESRDWLGTIARIAREAASSQSLRQRIMIPKTSTKSGVRIATAVERLATTNIGVQFAEDHVLFPAMKRMSTTKTRSTKWIVRTAMGAEGLGTTS